MVVREAAVVTRAGDSQTAIYAAYIRTSARSHLLRGEAGRDSRSVRDQVREILQQSVAGRCPGKGVAIHGLEQVYRMVASVARFPHGVLGQLTLKAKAPGMYFVRTKVGSKSGLILRTRIKGIGSK